MTLRHNRAALREKEFRDAYVEGHVKSYVAYQLRAIRERLGLTQKALAARIGKPQSVVSRLENTEYGKVTVQTLLDIAHGLDVALVVKFASFPEFLATYDDLSASALAVEPYQATERPDINKFLGDKSQIRIAEYPNPSGAQILPMDISTPPIAVPSATQTPNVAVNYFDDRRVA